MKSHICWSPLLAAAAIVGVLLVSQPLDACTQSISFPVQTRQTSDVSELNAADLERFADKVFAPYLREFVQPSLAVAVVHGDSLLLLKGYGRESSDRVVDPGLTLFNVASLSKLFTATAAMQLVERGALSLDNDITALLGRSVIRGDGPPITLRHLLTHTSGLDGAFMRDVVANPSDLLTLQEYLTRFPPTRGRRPGHEIRYSNIGLALAGRLIEVATRLPFEDYLERELFQPLGMHRSTFRQPVPAAFQDRVATYGSGAVPDALLVAPAGAMVSTASDMTRFMAAHLAGGQLGGRRILRLETTLAMQASQWRASGDIPGIGLGFFRSDVGGLPGVFHTGARTHFSLLYLVPEHRLGVFIVHAMRQGGPHQSLRIQFVRALLQRYFPRAVPQAASAMADVQGSWPALGAYAGVYRPSLLSTSNIERAAHLVLDTRVEEQPDGLLRFRIPGGPDLVLHRQGPAHFTVHGGSEDGLHVAFLTAMDGLVTGLAMSGNTQDPITFQRLHWTQYGTVHLVLLVVISVLLVLAPIIAAGNALGRLVRQPKPKRQANDRRADWAWRTAIVTGALVASAPLSTIALVWGGPSDDTAAAGLRVALTVGLTCLLAAMLVGLTLPVFAVRSWRRGYWGRWRRVYVTLLAAGVLVEIPLLYHYHLLGYWF